MHLSSDDLFSIALLALVLLAGGLLALVYRAIRTIDRLRDLLERSLVRAAYVPARAPVAPTAADTIHMRPYRHGR